MRKNTLKGKKNMPNMPETMSKENIVWMDNPTTALQVFLRGTSTGAFTLLTASCVCFPDKLTETIYNLYLSKTA